MSLYLTRGKTPGLRPGNGSPTKHRQAFSLLLYVPPIKEICEEIETWQYFITSAKIRQIAISVRKSNQQKPHFFETV